MAHHRSLLTLVTILAGVSGALAQTQIDNLNVADSFINFSSTASTCVNAYVYDAAQMVACCSSLVPASQPSYFSARNDLISNTLRPIVPSSIQVKLSATAPSGQICDPAAPDALVPGFTASLGSAPGAAGVAIQQAAPSQLDAGLCAFIRANGSGFGICAAPHSLDTLSSPAALRISKTHAGSFRQGETGAVYTVSVTNDGSAGPTSGAVTVTETVPSGLTLASMSGWGWTCGGNTCSRSDALNPGSSYPPIIVTVNVAANATSPQVNAVNVSGGGSGSANATDSTAVDPGAPGSGGVRIDNLNISDSVVNFSGTGSLCVNTYVFDLNQTMLACCSSLIPPGQQHYLSARNDLIGNPVTPATPASILVKLSASAPAGSSCDPTAPNAPAPGLTTSLGLTPGAAGLPFQQVAPAAGDLTRCSFIKANGGGFGICGLAHPVSSTGSPAALSIVKSHSGAFTQSQTGASYTVTVSNGASAGPTSGTVTVAETVPSGLMLVAMSGSGWTCGGNTCSRSDVLNSASAYPPITVTVNVAANATSPQVNSVSVSGGGSAGANATDATIVSPSVPEPPGTQINNLQTADSILNFSAIGNVCVNTYVLDMNQQMVACCSTAISASQSYFLSARNDLIGNPVTPATPASIRVKLSASQPVGGSCNAATPGIAVSGLTASLGAAAGAAGVPFQLTPPGPSDAVFCAFIQANGGGFGICRQAHPFSLNTYILSLGSGQAAGGGTVELPIQLAANNGAPSAFQADLSYDSQKLSFVSARKGEAATTAGKDVSAQTQPNNDVRLTSTGAPQATIGNGNLAYATFQLNSQFTSGSTPVALKNCLVNSGGVWLAAACSAGNVTGSATPAALSIVKTHTGSFTNGQTGALYTVTVSNAASASPTGGTVTVTETVPSGLTLVSMSGTGWTCVGNTCSRSDVLTPGSSYPFITVTVNVASGASSPQVNSVSVSGGGSATATATDSTVIVPSGPSIILPVTLTLNPNDQVSFPVILSAPAPAGSTFVTLSVSNPAVASLNTVNILIREGEMSSTRASLSALAVGSATVHASAFGYAGASTQVQVGSGGGAPGNPPGLGIVLPSNVTLYMGDQLLFPVGLSTPAPTAGVFITLSISNTAVASFNTANVVIAGGDTVSTRIRLNGIGPGTATITASAQGYPTVTQQVQVLTH